MANGSPLTDETVITTKGNDVQVEAGYVIQEPEVRFSVDGVALEGELQLPGNLEVTYDGVTTHTAGVDVTHPLSLDASGGKGEDYVYFEYCWWDESEEKDGVNGLRSEEEPELFSTSDGSGQHDRVMTSVSEIPITQLDHARTDDKYYMVEIFGYHVVGDEDPELFYRSNYNFIDIGSDNNPGRTTDTCYYFNVALRDETDKVISVEPADIEIYMGGHGGSAGVVDEEGNIVSENTSLPEPGFTVTLPSEIDAAVTELTFSEDDGERSWRFEPYDGKDRTTVYRLVPLGEGQLATRVQFRNSNDQVVTSDAFNPGEYVNQTLTVTLYKGEGASAVGDIVVGYDGRTYPGQQPPPRGRSPCGALRRML